jgi:hypothetical protein
VISNGIFSTLSTNTALAAKISTRIYPLVAPQNPVTPFITYQRISKQDTMDLEGKESLDIGRYQFKIYGKTYKEVQDVGELLKQAFEGKAFILMQMDDYEPDTKLFANLIDYQLTSDKF